MTTEAKLWAAMQRRLQHEQHPDLVFARIESAGTLVGVSDLEYVGRNAHGWVELKVARIPQQVQLQRPVRLAHDLTVEQSIWLMGHHKPRIHLFSWLLVGLHGDAAGWETLLLVEPTVAALICMKRITWRELFQHRAVHVHTSMDEALARINQGGAR